MEPVTVSSKFQVVIPREIRETLNIQPGEKMHVFHIDGRIELVRDRPMQSMKGRYKGMSTAIEKEPEDH